MSVAESGLGEATRRIMALEQERIAEASRHEAEASRLNREIAEAKHRRDLVLAGARIELVDAAEEVLDVRFPENVGRGDGPKVVARAIEDLAQGAPHLAVYYLGTKVYDRLDGQADGGTYGSVPRHGSTIFYVGLREPYRFHSSAEGRTKADLSPAQIDAAIAYLHALLGTLARP